jgi:predicted NAD/FAD-binding protein
LRLRGRPAWRSVVGGSQAYVARLTARYSDRIQIGRGFRCVSRAENGVRLRDADGREVRHDHVVIAAHADEALAMLGDPSADESLLLGALRYGVNDAVMHSDPALMPRRQSAWAAWNYIGGRDRSALCVTYWMNRLQGLPAEHPIFVTLNPYRQPAPEHVIHRERYAHPVFDVAAMRAQRRLWSLQGKRHTWFCGAYFGSGFHEDGLQAGLAVAEQLGGVRRPWHVAAESGRIHLAPEPMRLSAALA